ncbi:transglutaminase-like domain-containing protein [Nitratireductor basaltis]|uniref:Transglutaminase domain-containing protein n=1 Tax=Nitratireductor basaltis TaxID=472175 RepID=A0A084U8T8_9HYPH|nr:transglutaminase family protein [Nitratireductor basaltis]KFB09374.1 Transglutaminase domain-containing protein [Nitratireductor basaltis]
MLIRVGYGMTIEVAQPTHLFTMMSVHPERARDVNWQSPTETVPPVAKRAFIDQFGNSCLRMVAPAGEFTITQDAIVSDTGEPDLVQPDAREWPPEQLPDGCLRYLKGSRYCETDRLSQLAWRLFGNVTPGWARVQAVCDYVHDRLTFSYGYARSTRTALEAHQERLGVCRDFAHLAITFCRCLNIPARYVNGYLGDIGVEPDPSPMDFSAWFEVYLGGRWYTFDARHNHPRTGRIVVARGRDAMDVPLLHTFGLHTLKAFRVWTDEVDSRSRARSEPPRTAVRSRLGPPGRSPLDLGAREGVNHLI